MTRNDIRERYTHIVKTEKKWNCYFHVGVQDFTICKCRTKREAEWYAEMLAIAIEALIKEQTPLS
jgi:hypothetical protein